MNNCKKNLPKKENYDQCRYMYCIGPTARCNKSSYIIKIFFIDVFEVCSIF